MFGKIFRVLRRPPYKIRVSPHTKQLEIVPVLYLDIVERTDNDNTRNGDDYDINQLGHWEDDGDG